MSGEFDSRKDSQPTKFEQRPQIFVKLSFPGNFMSSNPLPCLDFSGIAHKLLLITLLSKIYSFFEINKMLFLLLEFFNIKFLTRNF